MKALYHLDRHEQFEYNGLLYEVYRKYDGQALCLCLDNGQEDVFDLEFKVQVPSLSPRKCMECGLSRHHHAPDECDRCHGSLMPNP